MTQHDADPDRLRAAARAVCEDYPTAYWRGLEPDRYPDAFVKAMTAAGLLAVLIPTEYGGSGLGLEQAAVILEEVNAAGGNASACHAQMYTMGTLLRHGTDAQKQRWLPQLASGEVRLQAFGVTEREAGSETPRIATHAERRGDGWVVNGHKAWTSRALHSDLMLLLARTAPYESSRRGEGLSVFLVDLRDLDGVTIRATEAMVNHATSEVFLEDVAIRGVSEPASRSVTPKACSRRSPAASAGSQRAFCASSPWRSRVPIVYIWAWHALALPPAALTASRMTAACSRPRPLPPYSVGISTPSRPSAVIARTNASG